MSPVFHLLARATLRRTREHWVRTLLLILGVALTSAVFIAVLFASFASVRSFERSTALLSSPRSIELRSRLGTFDESLLLPWLRHIDPAVGMVATLEGPLVLIGGDGQSSLSTLLGVQVLSAGTAPSERKKRPEFQAGSLLLADSALMKMGLRGQTEVLVEPATLNRRIPLALGVDTESFPILSDSNVISDLRTSQELLGKSSQVSAVIFEAPSITERERLMVDLESFLQESANLTQSLFVQTDESRRESVERLLAAFRSNIFIMVAMAFLVCVFTIFNVSMVGSLRIQQEQRVLKTLGVPRAMLFGSVFLESVLIGALGAGLGLSFGRPLTEAISGLFLGTVRDLYLGSIEFPALRFSQHWELYALAFGSGVLASCLGALYPAWRVSGVSGGFSLGGLAVPKQPRIAVLLCAAVVSSAAAFALIPPALRYNSQTLAFTAALLIIAALFLGAAPLLRLMTGRMIRGAFRLARTPGLLALSNALSSLGSHAFTVGVGASAVSLLLALSIMVGSFRSALQDWVEITFQADIFIRPQERGSLSQSHFVSPEVLRALSSMPEIAEISRYSTFASEIEKVPISISGADLEIAERRGTYRLLSGAFDQLALHQGSAVLISETAARKLGKKSGDSLGVGARSLKILGIFQDFSSERGQILFSVEAFRRIYPEVGVSSLAVYLKPGSDSAQVVAQLRSRFTDGAHFFTLNSELRGIVFSIFDQTFRITTLLRYVVLLICALGFLVSILQLVQERQRELKTLHTLGMSLGAMQLGVGLEALLLAIASSLLGALGGSALALLLIEVINPISFGWTFRPVFQAQYYLSATAILIAANLLAAAVPLTSGAKVITRAKLSME
ncbi:MAG: ABC transporter permease [Deltaproteobacteria bacterium]|nr:ABC transporter permease [Deltaproteobacteria bacterium]